MTQIPIPAADPRPLAPRRNHSDTHFKFYGCELAMVGTAENPTTNDRCRPADRPAPCPLALGRDRARDADVRDRRREAAGRDRTSGASARGRARLLALSRVLPKVLRAIRRTGWPCWPSCSLSKMPVTGLSVAPYPQPGADEGREAPPQARCCSWFAERDTQATAALEAGPLGASGCRSRGSGERDR